jgi:hypothetical protein
MGALPLLPLEFFRHYWQYVAGRFSEFRGVRGPASSYVAPFTLALDRGMDAVAHCAAPAARAGAAGGLAAQPVFVGLYRVISGQAAPLIAAHIAQREAVLQGPAFQLGRQSLRRSQPVILQQSVAAPGMGNDSLEVTSQPPRPADRAGPLAHPSVHLHSPASMRNATRPTGPHRAVSLVTIQFVTRLVTLLLELQPPPHIRSMLCADKFYGITERLKDLQPNRVATTEFLVHLALVDRLTRLTIQLL